MKPEKPISLIEILVALAVVAICVRFIWAKELVELENHALVSLGLPITSKYFVTVPLAAFFIYDIYRRESVKAIIKGIPVISKPAALFSLVLLSTAILLLVVSSNG